MLTAMIPIDHMLLGAAVLLFLSILASKVSGKLGVPALVLFLVTGMLAGSDGPGGIYFDDPHLSQMMGVVALAFILFAGGLDTNWQSVRSVLWKGLALSTLGVLITALLVGLLAVKLLGFTLREGMLLGAIVSSTDAAAVFSVLRARGVNLKGNIQPLLEFESGSNDPMAVFLTIGLIGLIQDPAASPFTLIPMFVWQMALGAILGYLCGEGMVIIANRLKLEYDGLYPPLMISMVLLTYSATASLKGNGFLAVYLAGLVMGNNDFIHKRSLMRFHDGLAWLMQIMMFLTLGLLVFPSRLVPIIGVSLLMAIFLIFVARPISVFATLSFTKTSVAEMAMVSWTGLRGAVPIILATYPLLAGIPKADMIFNLVFFIVLTSVLLQGTSIPLVAKWLGVEAPGSGKPKSPLELESSHEFKSELIEMDIPDNSIVIGKSIVSLGFPEGALIVLISRNNDFIVPSGGTIIEAGDTVLALGDKESLAQARSLVEFRQTGEALN